MPKTAVVLGGGFAGLSAAIHLALNHYEVSLLEQNESLGGKASEFRQDGFRFDTGPSVFTLNHVIQDLFKQADKPFPLTLEPLDLLCRYVFASGRVWDVYQDEAKTTAQLSSSEAKAYKALLQEAKKLYEASVATFVYGQNPTLFELAGYGLTRGLSAHPFKTLPQLLDSFGATGDLKQFFLRFATYFGADPYVSPAILHNICHVELGMGLSYPRGGIYKLVEAMQDLATDLGVSIKTSQRVKEIKSDRGFAKELVCEDEVFSADVVVSSLDIVRTHKLLGLATPLAKKPASLSGFVMLLGVEGQTEVAHHTISFAEDYEAEFEAIRQAKKIPDPTLYLNVSSKTEASDAPSGHENWFVMANAAALNAAEQPWSVEEEKAYAEHLMNIISGRGLAKKEQLSLKKSIGPNHLAKLAYRGSIYGSAPQSLSSTLRPAQSIKGIKNLALAGGTVFPGGGIPLAILSGKAAAEHLKA